MLLKISTDSLRQIGQLTLVTPRIAHQISHLAAHFLPTVIRILKFCIADMCAK